jgi:flavin-dependent thymidylate synthase
LIKKGHLSVIEHASITFGISGISRADARVLLPNAAATQIVITVNLRSLRHFFETRCAADAQWEIRNMAKELLKISYHVVPAVFEDLHKSYIVEDF